jgi:hypothetical protein
MLRNDRDTFLADHNEPTARQPNAKGGPLKGVNRICHLRKSDYTEDAT